MHPKRPLTRQRGYRDLCAYDPDDDRLPYSNYMLSQPAAISSLQDQKEPDEHVKTPIVLPTNSLQRLFESQDSEYVKTPILTPADSLQCRSLESEEDVKTPILIPSDSDSPQLQEDDIEPLTI
jgi:hypothetical protein